MKGVCVCACVFRHMHVWIYRMYMGENIKTRRQCWDYRFLSLGFIFRGALLTMQPRLL